MDLPVLSYDQYTLIYNAMSLTFAAFIGSFVFFLAARSNVGEKYSLSLLTSAIVVGIAAYHYFRIITSWGDAFIFENGSYLPSGIPFNDAYRYADWLITVPLLLVELILVLSLTREKTRGLLAKLIIAASAMIFLGYFGEVIKTDTSIISERGLWGFLSSIPFFYILYVLTREIWPVAKNESPRVKILLRNTLLLTFGAWGFYPIVYMAPFYGLEGAGAQTFLQVGYSIADLIAKSGYGLLIFSIAREKTYLDNQNK